MLSNIGKHSNKDNLGKHSKLGNYFFITVLQLLTKLLDNL